jgi:putative ABC transport system permease protein
MLMQDIRFALRLLRRDRGFAATAIFVLAVGIGVNNMFFTILYAHTLRGLPIAGADRILYISTFDDRSPDRAMSYEDFTTIRDTARGLEAVAAFTTAPITIGGDSRAAERLDAAFVSANAFDVIGASPVRGRGFVSADDGGGAAAVAMIGARVWRSRYGGDAAIVGTSILVNGAPATIVGIAPDESGLPANGEIWLTLGQAPGLVAQPRDVRTLRLLGRMREGARVADVRAEIEGIVNRLSREYAPANRGLRARVIPIDEQYFGRLSHPAWRAFIAASCLVALISWANVANLMLARSVRRARELAIRASLGASRARLVRQMIIEGCVLAAAGGAAGFVVSLLGVQIFKTAIPERVLPYWIHYSVDGRVIAALILVSMVSVVAFALLPAVRVSKPDVNGVLKDGGRAGAGDRTTGRWSTAFLVAEFALAVVLLAQLVVNFRTQAPTVPSDRALDTRAIVTAAVAAPTAKYANPLPRTELFARLQDRVRAIPGVTAVSIASAPPLSGAPEARLQIAGGDVGSVRSVVIGSGYFETLRVPLVRGRDFTEEDGRGQPAAIVNEQFVSRFLAGRDPIGQQIALTAGDAGKAADMLTIIGVANNVRQRAVPEPDPMVYLPYRATAPANVVLLTRSSIDPAALVPLLRKEVLALDPDLPVYRIQTMADVMRNAQWNARVSQRLILLITFIAIALSTVGLYAVTAHGVNQRRQEIGVRMALGAQPRQVLMIVARRVVLHLVLGLAAGIVCTLAWQRMFTTERLDLSIMEPGALGTIAATLTIAALIACYIPARRAIRLDPVTAIRGD